MAKQGKGAAAGRPGKGGRRPTPATDARQRRARRNRRAAMARARAAAPNGPAQYAARAALIERAIRVVVGSQPIDHGLVENVAADVCARLADDTGDWLSTRTIRRHIDRLGLIARPRPTG
jgi:hypothetical protein